jgi:hypothetical protein
VQAAPSAAAGLTPMTMGASKAALMRKGPRFRRRQAWVSSPNFLAAPSLALLDLRGWNTPSSMSQQSVPCGRNGQLGLSTLRAQSGMPRQQVRVKPGPPDRVMGSLMAALETRRSCWEPVRFLV